MAFDLKSIHKGKKASPPRIVVYGAHGIGKSSFAAGAPSPVFVLTEDGVNNLEVDSLPLCKSYDNAIQCVRALFNEEHEYKTVVLDSLDWLEALVWKHVCKAHGKDGIEDFGYGKGYVLAADLMREFLAALNSLRNKRNMAVILTAHSKVRKFNDPTSEAYDRFALSLHTKSAAIVSEWADVIAFAQNDLHIASSDGGFNKKRTRAVTSGQRFLNVERTPAFDAKNRLGLPPKLPLSWGAFETAMKEAK